MLNIEIPGFGEVQIAHLILDYNGTIAEDGIPVPGLLGRLQELSRFLGIHVITADTFGSVGKALSGFPVQLSVLPPGDQDLAKQALVEKLGASRVFAVGNGYNDALMLQTARIGVAVLLGEGLSARAFQAADLVMRNIDDALDLLCHPRRLVATLRN